MKAALVLLCLAATAMAMPRRNVIGRIPERIVGGEEAVPHEYPWQVSMLYFGSHICGGSIYNQDTIITAAHCAEISQPSAFSVAAGKHNLNQNEQGEQTIAVASYQIHEGYPGSTGFSNDIAILKLASPLQYSATVGPVAIAPQDHLATGDSVCSGWGALSEGGPSSPTLQKVEVPLVSDAECGAAYGSTFDGPTMICAGLPEGGKDACQGDSGGPLLASDLGTGYYLAGIVSWGFGCARPGYPGVYTEVSTYNNWIRSHA